VLRGEGEADVLRNRVQALAEMHAQAQADAERELTAALAAKHDELLAAARERAERATEAIGRALAAGLLPCVAAGSALKVLREQGRALLRMTRTPTIADKVARGESTEPGVAQGFGRPRGPNAPGAVCVPPA
jgi:hypothetical protein